MTIQHGRNMVAPTAAGDSGHQFKNADRSLVLEPPCLPGAAPAAAPGRQAGCAHGRQSWTPRGCAGRRSAPAAFLEQELSLVRHHHAVLIGIDPVLQGGSGTRAWQAGSEGGAPRPVLPFLPPPTRSAGLPGWPQLGQGRTPPCRPSLHRSWRKASPEQPWSPVPLALLPTIPLGPSLMSPSSTNTHTHFVGPPLPLTPGRICTPPMMTRTYKHGQEQGVGRQADVLTGGAAPPPCDAPSSKQGGPPREAGRDARAAAQLAAGSMHATAGPAGPERPAPHPPL